MLYPTWISTYSKTDNLLKSYAIRGNPPKNKSGGDSAIVSTLDHIPSSQGSGGPFPLGQRELLEACRGHSEDRVSSGLWVFLITSW